jgi:hypothetical protein
LALQEHALQIGTADHIKKLGTASSLGAYLGEKKKRIFFAALQKRTGGSLGDWELVCTYKYRWIHKQLLFYSDLSIG